MVSGRKVVGNNYNMSTHFPSALIWIHSTLLKWLNLSQSPSGGIEFVFSHRPTPSATRWVGVATGPRAPHAASSVARPRPPPKKITSYKDFADPWLGSADLGFITADCTNVLSRFQLMIACIHLIRIDVRLFCKL